MRRAVAAEWGKLWSLRAPWFCVLAALMLTVFMAFTLANDFTYDIARNQRPAADLLPVIDPLGTAMQVGQLVLVALAMIVVTSEYGTGVVRATFLARPRRRDVLLAKTVVAGAVGFAAGLGCAAAGWAVAAYVLGGHARPGAPVPACLRIALTVALACALTTAVASMLRSGTGTLTAMFVLLAGLQFVDPRYGAYLPAGAGVAFVTGDGSYYPYGLGLAVLAAWALAAQLLAHVLLVRRDA